MPGSYNIDSEQLEEIRTECAKHGRMDLFTQICHIIGREEDDDYVAVSNSESESDTDDEPVSMGETVKESLEVVVGEDGFQSLK